MGKLRLGAASLPHGLTAGKRQKQHKSWTQEKQTVPSPRLAPGGYRSGHPGSLHSTWAKTSIPLAYYKCVDDTKLFFDSVFLPKLHIFSLSVYQIFPFHDYTSTQDPTERIILLKTAPSQVLLEIAPPNCLSVKLRCISFPILLTYHESISDFTTRNISLIYLLLFLFTETIW